MALSVSRACFAKANHYDVQGGDRNTTLESPA
jgi:hypothetical protein